MLVSSLSPKPPDLLEAINCLKGTIANLTGTMANLTDAVEGIGKCTDEPQTRCPEIPTQLEDTSSPPPSQDTCPPSTEPACPPPDPPSLCECGGCCGWRKVAYHNLSDTRYTCPAGWHLTPPPARGCGRESHEEKTCDSVKFEVEGSYSQICGVVQGYQFGSTAAFYTSHLNRSITIDDSYATGVSITRGNPRQHVWTYAAGRYERANANNQNWFCPCEQVSATFIPSFVGACWYCESGNNAPYGSSGYHLFSDDVLWDGDGCNYEGRCCQFDGPLCFSQALPEPTSGPIEVRICNHHTSQYSNVIISHLELYVK